MIYVVDTCIFRSMLGHVYRSVNPEIWNSLEYMLSSGEIVSVKEAYKELERQFAKDGKAMTWLKSYKSSFHGPTNKEALIVKQIYANPHFRHGVKEKNIIQGMPVADAFLVAKAKVVDGILVTRETFSPNAAKIPNMCEMLNVNCINEEQFQLMLKRRS